MQRLPGANFQPNNARPHTAKVSQDCLRAVNTLPRPARSPDQYDTLIEHIWDHLGRRIGHPMGLKELEARLQQIWNEMSHTESQCLIQNLYTSMPDRTAWGIRAGGRSTGYYIRLLGFNQRLLPFSLK
ncbi:transposable element Tcb1 transposase [Trichonephila clavipes]|nr:transposable element Tcb1 transposase [Trichonephila clavipes]